MEMFSLENKVAIVTGAGRGIGRSVAIGLAEAGAKVIVCSRTESELVTLQQEINAIGGECAIVTCDVEKTEQVQHVINFTKEKYGTIDILINNAGITKKVAAKDLALEDFEKIISVNLTGVFLFAQLAGRVMIEQGFGSIINVSSVASEQGITGSVAYAASKGGVTMLTKTLALEWAKLGVRVNAIAPAYVETPLVEAVKNSREGFEELVNNRTPLGRMAKPQEMVGACIFLASEASTYITGETIFLDGGWRTFGL
ncbi:SDR family NAD(P)-dependent oxidoreductase [Solibacillus sp. FSL K6-1523]|uniref:SDR family NAD(P)-dependent oxidoreductase n=1 Tax=Solibacillus sp. FSL K6-1523 TaxID=2921471 RepID=UPI0030F543B8